MWEVQKKLKGMGKRILRVAGYLEVFLTRRMGGLDIVGVGVRGVGGCRLSVMIDHRRIFTLLH